MTLVPGTQRQSFGRLLGELAVISVLAAVILRLPHGGLSMLLICFAAVAILAQPAVGVALIAISVPLSGWWTLPLAGGAKLTWTPLLLGWTSLAWLIRRPKNRWPSKSGRPLMTALGLYLAVLAASAWRAPNLLAAFFEMARWVELGVALVIAADVVTSWQGRTLLLLGLHVAGVAAAALAIHPWSTTLEAAPFLVAGSRVGRAFGTFGQPNPFAAFMNLVWPMAIALALVPLLAMVRGRQEPMVWSRQTSVGRTAPAGHPLESALWSMAGLATATLCLAGLFRSWSRGGWLAGAGAAIVMALLVALVVVRPPVGRRQRFTLWLGIVALVAGALCGLRVQLPPTLVQRVASAGIAPGTTNVADAEIDDTNFATVERLAHWHAAIAMWSDKPWLGQGPGHFEVVYARYRLPRWPEPLGHAHNYYLHALAESGLVGLLFFVVFLMAAWGCAIRTIFRSTAPLSAAAGLGLAGVVAAISLHSLVDNVFVHEMPVFLGLLCGLACGLAET